MYVGDEIMYLKQLVNWVLYKIDYLNQSSSNRKYFAIDFYVTYLNYVIIKCNEFGLYDIVGSNKRHLNQKALPNE